MRICCSRGLLAIWRNDSGGARFWKEEYVVMQLVVEQQGLPVV
jgi:hypothetical protein